MKKRFLNIYTIACLSLSMGLLSSCDSMLKETKYDFVNFDDIEDSPSGANQLVIGAYNKLSDDIFRWGNMNQVLDFDSDYISGPDWSLKYVGAGSFQGSEHTGLMWEQLYTLIHKANAAIEYIEPMVNVPQRYKESLLGELYFLKAYSYFTLVRAFGDLPIYKQSLYVIKDINQPRQSIEDVHTYIIELLKDAETMMYKNTDSGFVEGRASAGAAASLLAKVYVNIAAASKSSGQVNVRGGVPYIMNGSTKLLTDPVLISVEKNQVKGYENFDSQAYFVLARDKAQEIIEGKYGTYELLPFNKLWRPESKNKVEHIWSLQTKSSDEIMGTTLSRGYSGTEDENGDIVTGLWWGMRDHWYKLFEDQDYRINDGVIHRFVTPQSRALATPTGYYYPNNDIWKNKSQGYKSGEVTVPPEYPFNDSLKYSVPTGARYLAFLTKYYYVTDRRIERTDSNWPFLRYADILLIYAEAANEANGGPTQKALDALNLLRDRNNASQRSLTGDGNINDVVLFRSAVLEERAMEFATEGDRRWDLIRWGIYLQVMNSIGGNDEVGINKNRESRNLLYPLPTSETSTNKKIKENNPGWS